MMKNTLRRQSLSSTALRSKAGESVLAGARRVAVTMLVAEAVEPVVVVETASTAESLATCLASARNPRSPETLATAVAVVVVATASTVGSLVTCPKTVRSPRRPVVVAVAAETASTADSQDTCPESATSQRNLVSPESLAAGQVVGLQSDLPLFSSLS